MNTDHDMVSGFGSDDINNFGQDAFWEALNSAIGTNAELYNYDLSICTQIRAIILNKVQDTKLKTLNRNALVSIGTCKAGMYIKYDNRFWLIVGVVDNNSVYEKATMVLCNHLLTWLNSKGQVIQRWANLSSASQYNNGETSTEFYFVRSDQLLVVIPDDDESLLLTSGVRFVIDRRCKIYEKNFNDSVTLDTSNPIVTYKLTRADSVLYYYQDSGHFEFLATQDEQHENDGYYVVDDKGYWLCDIPKVDNKMSVLLCDIETYEPAVYVGVGNSKFVAKYYNQNNEEVQEIPNWEIDCDFKDELDVTYDDNALYISANNKKLVGKTFNIILSGDNYVSKTLTVTIKSFI